MPVVFSNIRMKRSNFLELIKQLFLSYADINRIGKLCLVQNYDHNEEVSYWQ